MREVDGARGEGGGQLLRTTLALAVVTGRPVRVVGIRAGRARPGLRPQHLTAVRALAAIGAAEVTGAELGSTTLEFAPSACRAGRYTFDVGTAGAVTLVLQAMLLPLAVADGPSAVTLVGGTHVPASPPVEYLRAVLLPALARVGVRAEVRLRRYGWYPRGGGAIDATVVPVPRAALGAFVAESPPVAPLCGVSVVSRLPATIAERQRAAAVAGLASAGVAADVAVVEDRAARGPGTLVFLAHAGRAGVSALGRRGLPAEAVAAEAVGALLAFRESGAAVDERLADQLVPFLALGPRPSRFTCPRISSHLATVAWVVEQFLPVRVRLDPGTPAHVGVEPVPPRVR